MPDYGHSLDFGVFITPSNAPAHTPVERALLAEDLGFDLATFQDHPYQPTFHDTWTLMSWVAASTTRLRLTGNVLNLPLRQPVVLARSVASLDLLSGGRIELGLGAGAFWDAIEAMGGTRLTPGEGVTALGEALEIIRGVWDASESSPLRVDGTFHRVNGAKRGPAPAHPIPIWLGAYKPRMLRLIGRSADGWLPSLSYLNPGDLQAGNTAIDDAATQAGRTPREIRRLLNVSGQFSSRSQGPLVGPADQWVEELTDLALSDGIATFILGSDDPEMMRIFAAEVAPAVRESVASERADRGTPTGGVISAKALARRREGIEYEVAAAADLGEVIEPGDAAFGGVRNTYMRGGSPGLVLRPTTALQVANAVAFARQQSIVASIPLSVRSGGHGISGRSTNDGGIVIDVGQLNQIDLIDAERALVRVGPGAHWAEVAAALDPYDLALSSGDYGGVGVGGLATAGGVGFLGRDHGLTIDRLRAAEIVLADSSLVRVSADENADLFWALRGAGANLGIVTAFEFEAAPAAEVGWVQLNYDASETVEFLTGFGAAMEAAPRDVTLFLLMGAPQRDGRVGAQVYGVVNSPDPDTILERLQPFAEIGPLVGQQVRLARYAQVMNNASQAPHAGYGEPHSRSTLIEHVTPEFANDVVALLRSGASHFFQIRSVGGAINDVPADATAYAGRSANFSVTALGGRADALDAAFAPLRAQGEGTYFSFDTSPAPTLVTQAFPPATLARLREIKRAVDPANLFRDNGNVLTGR